MVMFIVLSGQYPFHGKTKDELLNKIRALDRSSSSLRGSSRGEVGCGSEVFRVPPVLYIVCCDLYIDSQCVL